MALSYFTSPCGLIAVSANELGVTALTFVESREAIDSPSTITELCKSELTDYFAGTLRHFSVPLAASGTHFQKRVWSALAEIGYGQTRCYGDIAAQLQQPTAARAVGMANGRNPISIIVPCHRVIGKNGTLTGYAGGLDRKRFLLKLEGVL